MDTYLGTYNTVHFIVDSRAALNPGGCESLYRHLLSHLKEKAAAIRATASTEVADESLIDFYRKQRETWSAAGKTNGHMLKYFERHWITNRLSELELAKTRAAVQKAIVPIQQNSSKQESDNDPNYIEKPPFAASFKAETGWDISKVANLHNTVWDLIVFEPLKERLEACARKAAGGSAEGTERSNTDGVVVGLRKPDDLAAELLNLKCN